MFLSPKNACMCQNSISSSDILNIAMKSNSISIKNTLVYALAIIAAALLISFGGLSNSSFSGLTIIPERALAMGGGGGYIPLIPDDTEKLKNALLSKIAASASTLFCKPFFVMLKDIYVIFHKYIICSFYSAQSGTYCGQVTLVWTQLKDNGRSLAFTSKRKCI